VLILVNRYIANARKGRFSNKTIWSAVEASDEAGKHSKGKQLAKENKNVPTVNMVGTVVHMSIISCHKNASGHSRYPEAFVIIQSACLVFSIRHIFRHVVLARPLMLQA
jgi:hypothetical protein